MRIIGMLLDMVGLLLMLAAIFGLIALAAALSGCMPEVVSMKPDVTVGEVIVQAPEEYACNVSYTPGEGVFYVACPGQEPVGIPLLPGPEGPRGDDGEPGRDGTDGTDGEPGAEGPEGPTGPIGEQGPRGDPGIQGPSGPDGTPAILETIDPCGPTGSDEIILRLNALVCDISLNCTDLFRVSGKYLTGLYPGDYITPDPKKCKFTVDDDLNVTW